MYGGISILGDLVDLMVHFFVAAKGCHHLRLNLGKPQPVLRVRVACLETSGRSVS